MRVDVIQTLADFTALEPAWDAAVASDPGRPLHVSFPWIRAWWETFGVGRRMCVMVVRDEGRVAGLAPLMVEERRLGWLRLPLLRLVGNDLSLRSDIVLVEPRADVVDALVRAMLALPWACFELGHLAEGAPVIRLLARHVGQGFLSMHHRHAHPTPAVSLTGSWDDYLAAKSRNFRRSLRRAEARASGEVVRWFPEDFDDFEAMLGGVRQVAEATWAHREGTSVASSTADWSFYARVMREAHREGRLIVSFVSASDGPVAFLILVGHGDVLYALKMGYREERGESGPGMRLMAASLEREFRRRRWRAVDFDCATTRSDWKRRWATESTPVLSYYLFRRSGLGRAAAGLYRAKRLIGRRLT